MKNIILYLLFILSIVLVYGLVFSISQGAETQGEPNSTVKKINIKTPTIIFSQGGDNLFCPSMDFGLYNAENIKK